MSPGPPDDPPPGPAMPPRLAAAAALAVSFFLFSSQTGCAKRKMPVPDTGPLDVKVARPVVKPVADFLDFTGRLDAVNSVDVRPRVTGYIIDTPFKEGDIV